VLFGLGQSSHDADPFRLRPAASGAAGVMGEDVKTNKELQAIVEKQSQDIAELRAAIGYLINGLTAAGSMSFELSNVAQLSVLEDMQKAFSRDKAASSKLIAGRQDFENNVKLHSKNLDDAIKSASNLVWDDDGKFKV
jgi:hypothetical protein